MSELLSPSPAPPHGSVFSGAAIIKNQELEDTERKKGRPEEEKDYRDNSVGNVPFLGL